MFYVPISISMITKGKLLLFY